MDNLSIIGVFIAGTLSFFSPCILPVIPLYLSYLSEDSNERYSYLKVFLNTFAFIVGLLSVFLIYSLGIKYLSTFLLVYKNELSVLGGIIIILMALHQLNIITINPLNKNKKINLKYKNYNIFKSFILGFIFSFAWTPCVGPVLISIVGYSISSFKPINAFYILIYGLGFSLPFIIISLLKDKALKLLKNKQKLFNLLFKFLSIVLLLVGIYVAYNGFKGLADANYRPKDEDKVTEKSKDIEDFKLYDQNNNLINIKDYRGKYVMITFSTSWCQYCLIQNEMLNEYYQRPDRDIEIFIIMNEGHNVGGPSIEEYAKDMSISVLNDKDGSLFNRYGIYSYPQSFFINPNGEPIAKLPGALTKAKDLEKIIKQVKDMKDSD